VPDRGELVIFDHSWYRRVVEERVQRLISEQACREAFNDIVEFERMLAEDGTAFVKFFLHISRKEQKKRFKAIAADPLEAWRVTKEDWARYKKYDEYAAACEEMFELTESDYAPWTIVEATSRWFARRKVMETLIGAMERRLGAAVPPRPVGFDAAVQDADLRAAMESVHGGEL
jgi:polyphosphate kinase 2 (PPK2 family)